MMMNMDPTRLVRCLFQLKKALVKIKNINNTIPQLRLIYKLHIKYNSFDFSIE